MGVITEQHIAAQEWICGTCGGHDRKSCGCAGARATSRAIERLAAKCEQDRQRAKAYRERKAAAPEKPSAAPLAKPSVSRDATIKNTEESPEASAEAMKAEFAKLDADDGAVEADLKPAIAECSVLTKPLAKTAAIHAGTPITARGLIRILADATPAVRTEAVEALLSGQHQFDFEAVTKAVADLYQQLSKAGR